MSFGALMRAREQDQSSGRVANPTGKTRSKTVPNDDDFKAALAEKCRGYIRLWDAEEDSRRRSDREGANGYYSRHWMVAVPRNRAAITCNILKPLVDHSISIMTKQEPTWVVTPDDTGDVHGARLMRSVLMRQYREDDMMLKSRLALRLAKTTRTCGAKTMWDVTKRGGAGDITTDIIPGWRLILDNRTRFPERMRFIGDRALMSRSRAMLLYPEAAGMFVNKGEATGPSVIGDNGTAQSPIPGQFSGAGGVDAAPYGSGASSSGTIVNGHPVVTAFTARGPASGSGEFEVEIIELYHRDHTLVPVEVPIKDEFGQEVRRIATDGDGRPQFTQDGDWDEILGEPGFRLVWEAATRTEMRPKYPFWRRTTLLMPDGIIVDDRAWDAPQPYSLLSDNEPLEGAVGKGTLLEGIDIQAALNVSLSTMLDNLRFSAYRAFKASNQAQIEKANLIINPGDIIRTGTDVSQFEALQFPEVSSHWFGWVNLCIGLLEKLFGLEGIMQGSAKDAPRTDSAKGFDSLAEIGGSRVVEQTQRFERWLSDIGEKVGWWAQRRYTEEHAIRIEDLEGNLTWERGSSPQLFGTYSYNVAIGSTLAWNASAIRARLLEDLGAGLRDKTSVWKHPQAGIDDWQEIKQRLLTEPPQLGAPPPPRTRQQLPKQPRPKMPKPRAGTSGQFVG